MVKNLPASAGDAGDMASIPGAGRFRGVGVAHQPSILAWETPRTVEPGGLQSMGPQRVGHN